MNTAEPDLVHALHAAGVAEVSVANVDRAAYSSDGSLFRIVPSAVVFPTSAAEVAATMQLARDRGIPLTSRGAGTSIAGNAIGAGIVLDFSRHMNTVLSLDPEDRSAWVEPGCVHATLQQAASAHGLRFGPDPSTHTRCTIGGMIGNNACGPRALGYGKTGDNILALEVLLADGSTVMLDGENDAAIFPRLHTLINNNLAAIRTHLGTFSRQVSGYALEHLLPENGFDLRRAFAGSEGTWGIVLRAKMRLVIDPPHKTTVVLGYPDMAAAGDDVPVLRNFPVTACEGMDSRMTDRLVASRGPQALPQMPAGQGWMLVELAGDDEAQLQQQATELIAAAAAGDAVIKPGDTSAQLWKIRADGAGLVSRTPDGRDAHAGWEDSAVPIAHLGQYLRELDELLNAHGLWGIPYGHFGDGCLHMRVDFPLDRAGGRQVMREFMFAAADLVAKFGGSVSGEHGDGRARSELLPRIYPPEIIDLFAQVKQLFDPLGVLNPGILVDPAPLDADIRVATVRAGDGPARHSPGMLLPADDGEFAQAVHRCTGVGKCRADSAAGGGVMCPSYQATRDEKHSTRGRARVLQEMVNGSLVAADWAAPEVAEALDLCLSCKACASECPTGTDMAAYKAEVLYQRYRGKLRPMNHYVLGWLPLLAKVSAPLAPVVNTFSRVPGVSTVLKKVAGIDPRRAIPTFTARTFTHWFHNGQNTAQGAASAREVVLYADTWSNYFAPRILAATVELLRTAGVTVRVLPSTECCGLTWISTGQLDTAKHVMSRAVDALDATGELPIIGVEPSCTAALKEESSNLLGTPAAARVASRMYTLAEYLLAIGWTPPRLDGVEIVAQPHCHHNAVLGFEADRELLARAGAQPRVLGGCCGLAGNFGVEAGHYDTSVQVAHTALLPALTEASSEAIVLADGYSCRTQITDLSQRRGVHLAELLAWRQGLL